MDNASLIYVTPKTTGRRRTRRKTSRRTARHRCQALRKYFHLKAAVTKGASWGQTGLCRSPHRDKPSPQNCGEESQINFIGGVGFPLPPPALSAPGTMRSGRCFREGRWGKDGTAPDGKEEGGFERGTAGRGASAGGEGSAPGLAPGAASPQLHPPDRGGGWTWSGWGSGCGSTSTRWGERPLGFAGEGAAGPAGLSPGRSPSRPGSRTGEKRQVPASVAGEREWILK